MTIRPCPLCGGVVEIHATLLTYYGTQRQVYGIQCIDDDCGIAISGFASDAAAVAKWNQRPDDNDVLLAFYNEVCDQAERNMAATNTVSGAHWNAMRQVLKRKGIEVSR